MNGPPPDCCCVCCFMTINCHLRMHSRQTRCMCRVQDSPNSVYMSLFAEIGNYECDECKFVFFLFRHFLNGGRCRLIAVYEDEFCLKNDNE